MANLNKIVIAITGASGSIYAKQLIIELLKQENKISELALVMSKNAENVWQHELGNSDFKKFPIKRYETHDFNAPFASGSARFNIMFICPCSMGTLARIANGISDSLITRAADVMLKERRKLILISRDTPLSLIHINNMKTITEAGGIILPASPSFYSQPSSIEELANTVVHRAIDIAGIEISSYRWNEK